MKRHLKILAVLLVTTLMINLFPVQSLATLITDSPVIDPPYVNDTVKPEGKIIGEVVEKRDKNIKQFKKDDSTFEADIFPFAVHYPKDGKWQDIDNTLVDGQDEENNQVLENKDNEYKVKIAKNSSSSKLARIQKDGYEVSWILEGAQSVVSQVKPLDQTLLNGLSENDKKRTLRKISSEVNFIDIFSNIDLQYLVNPEELKENIIIKEKVDNPSFKRCFDNGLFKSGYN